MAGFSKFQIAKLDLLVGPIRIVIHANRFDFVFNLPRRKKPPFLERMVSVQLLYAAKAGSTSHVGIRIYLVLRRQGLGSTSHAGIRIYLVLWRQGLGSNSHVGFCCLLSMQDLHLMSGSAFIRCYSAQQFV